MREITAHSFEEGNIPSDWLLQTMNHQYERGCLRSGCVTALCLPLPGPGWRSLRIEAEVEPCAGAVVECGDDVFSINLKIKERGCSRHSINKHAATMVESVTPVPDRPGIRHVVFTFDRGQMRGEIDGEEIISVADPAMPPFTGHLRVGFWDDCLIHSLRLLGADPLPAPLFPVRPRRGRPFLEVAADFYDDWFPDDSAVLLGERIKYSRAMYEEFFAQLKRCGARRVPWNYHDLIESDTPPGIMDEQDVGDNFALAVETAHRHGLEIFGTIKPLEKGYFARYAAAQPGRFVARKPGAWGEGENRLIQRIDLVKEDDRPCAFSVNDVIIHVSDDNQHYRPYTGPGQRAEAVEDYPAYEPTSTGRRPTGRTYRARVMRFTGLEIPQKYIVLSVPGRTWSFANRLVDLVHLFGEKGEETMLTYGTASNTNVPFVMEGGLEKGIVFDLCTGTPTACLTNMDAIREPFIFDLGQGFLGVARSKAQYLEVGSPSFPEVREWWLSWVRGILAAGADGVTIRYRNHCSSFTWGEFGFEQPVRDEYLRRTGVDIWQTDEFDRALWRRIRGEGFTEFCRQARAVTRQAGKTLGLHIDAAMNVEPDEGATMQIHWDWRTWLKERLADYVLLKEVWPGSRFGQEILSLARAQGIAAVVSRYAFATQWKEPGCEQVLDGWLKAADEGGFDGFQFYDSAALLRGFADRQRVLFKNPAVREVLRRHFIHS